ncbi:MAG: DNA-binding protein WhiA [Lachnospiraceae bacterium]|nr:DNA-binding protein WhiA [Lachnospiraceae bacterium]
MSFSSDVKEELTGEMPAARHCQIAEIAGMLAISGDGAGDAVGLSSDNAILQRKFFTLLLKAFNIEKDLLSDGKYVEPGQAVLDDKKKVQDIRKAISHPMLLSMECCQKAYIRGTFLAGGSISDPEKYYHFEIVCGNEETADTVRRTMNNFGLDAKIVMRKNSWVVYLKEGEQIVHIIGLMGAGKSLMKLETVRIWRDFRGKINRRVNCETANLNRTAVTSVRQVEDIRLIEKELGFGFLPPPLRQMAEARLQHPEASLKELGEAMEPRLGKSGVNHRLRKLGEIADKLRIQKTDES